MASKNLIQALAVTAELCGSTELSEMAAKAFLRALETYPEQAVLAALTRCQRELTGRLTLAAVLQRIPGSRPGAEEAWTIAAKGGTSESVTKVWTHEMAVAFSAVQDIYDFEGPIPARMAFKEIYAREVAQSEADGRPVEWRISEGHNAAERGPAIERAIAAGYITAQDVPQSLRHLISAPSLPAKDVLRLVAVGGQLVGAEASQEKVEPFCFPNPFDDEKAEMPPKKKFRPKSKEELEVRRQSFVSALRRMQETKGEARTQANADA